MRGHLDLIKIFFFLFKGKSKFYEFKKKKIIQPFFILNVKDTTYKTLPYLIFN